METLKGTQKVLQCPGCFAVTDGGIVVRPTYSNFNKRGPCTLFSQPNIVSIIISCNGCYCLRTSNSEIMTSVMKSVTCTFDGECTGECNLKILTQHYILGQI